MKRGKRIGVYICHCGRNIAGYVDIQKLMEKISRLRWVSLVRDNKYLCSEEGQAIIKGDIREGLIDRVVIASCSPAMHEKTFRRAIEGAGLNPFLYQHVNIREGCSWVTPDREEATHKAFELIKAGVQRVRFLEPLEPLKYRAIPRTLIIGGGLAGITAALDISEAGFGVVLVEREAQLGGWANRIWRGFPNMIPVREYVNEKVKQLLGRPNVKILLNSEVLSLEGFTGNFTARIRCQGEVIEEKVGTVIVATGFSPFDASRKPEFGYGRHPSIITTADMEELLGSGLPEGSLQRVAFIHCVGSRDQTVGNPYCSRVCCTVVAKQALLLKQSHPQTHIYVFFMDVRTFGKGYEELFEEAQRAGVIYVRANPGEIFPRGDKLVLRYEDTLLERPAELEVDMVVLAIGMEPPKGTRELMKRLRLNASSDGFFLEAHPKLGPVDTTSEGIYLAGCCQGPKDLPDTLSQAHAAAARATKIFHLGEVTKDPITAVLDPEACSLCRLCEKVCEFGALSFDPKTKRMKVTEAACRGCGACAATCPSGAISLRHFNHPQILPLIQALTG